MIVSLDPIPSWMIAKTRMATSIDGRAQVLVLNPSVFFWVRVMKAAVVIPAIPAAPTGLRRYSSNIVL